MPRKAAVALAAAAVVILAAAPRLPAQQGDDLRALQKEVEALKTNQAEMKKGIDEILKILEPFKKRQEAMQFKPQDMSVADAPFIGKKDAPVTLVEFLDYQCPFCQRYHQSTEPEILKEYVSTGKVKYVVRQFPLTSLHPAAMSFAQAALCAGDQGKYWDMGSDILGDPKKTESADLTGYAKGLGLDTAAFDKCVSSGKYKDRIQAEQAMGLKLGISGTPSFALGLTDPHDPSKLKATSLIRGAQPFDQFKQQIDELLGGQKKGA